jgi:hypothetical protein
MDLLAKVAIIVVLLIVVFSAVFILTKNNTQSQFTAAHAKQLLLSEISASNPGANVTVLNISNSSLKSGNYNIVLSIVYNSTRPCPTLFIEEYNEFPTFQQLNPKVDTDNLYTKNCVIYGLQNASANQYVISSPEVAIARSYNQSVKNHVSNVTDYVGAYGYDNTSVTARLFNNEWLIRYQALHTNYSVNAVMYPNGTISKTYINTTE